MMIALIIVSVMVIVMCVFDAVHIYREQRALKNERVKSKMCRGLAQKIIERKWRE